MANQANRTEISSVDSREKALDHLESVGVDTAELGTDVSIIWAAKEAGFFYPNWQGELDRVIEAGGDMGGFETLTTVENVRSKKGAIEHLRSIGIPTDHIERMDDAHARAYVDYVAGEEGYVYPNYRPL